MNISVVIYIIVIIFGIIKIANKAKGKNVPESNNEKKSISGSYSNKPSGNYTGNQVSSSNENQTGSYLHQNIGTRENVSGNTASLKSGYQESNKTETNQKKVDAGVNQGSQTTVDFLKNKANNDKIQHQKEDRKTEINNQKFLGNLKIAERLILGDPIPQGKQMIRCRYCAAENLIPNHSTERYNCYFCRENL